MKILVTVGMGQWPFDRLLRGIIPLCAEHEVFAQTGTSTLALPCESRAFLSFDGLQARIADADLVITHAGNTVRLAQRQGKLPIATARVASLGEMANDHQLAYLRHEEKLGRVVAAWNPDDIPRLVSDGPSSWRLTDLVPRPSAADAAQKLSQIWSAIRRNPFSWKTVPQLAYLWEELAFESGRHLHLGSDAEALGAALKLARQGDHFEARSVSAASFTEPLSAGFYRSISVSSLLDSGIPVASLMPWICDGIAADGSVLIATAARRIDDVVSLLSHAGFAVVRRETIGRHGLLTARRDGQPPDDPETSLQIGGD